MSSVGTLFPLLVWHLDGQRPGAKPGVHRDEGGTRTVNLSAFSAKSGLLHLAMWHHITKHYWKIKG